MSGTLSPGFRCHDLLKSVWLPSILPCSPQSCLSHLPMPRGLALCAKTPILQSRHGCGREGGGRGVPLLGLMPRPSAWRLKWGVTSKRNEPVFLCIPETLTDRFCSLISGERVAKESGPATPKQMPWIRYHLRIWDLEFRLSAHFPCLNLILRFL